MSDWYCLASAEQLAAVEKAAGEFRRIWNGIELPFSTSFTGEMTDVRAMDYIDYESLGTPACGIEGAALVWGEVLRQLFGMQWVISYRGDYMLAFPEDDWPSVVIWPFARLLELTVASTPQLGKYGWAMERAILDVMTTVGLSDEQEQRLSQIIDGADVGYLKKVAEDVRLREPLRRILKLPQKKERKR